MSISLTNTSFISVDSESFLIPNLSSLVLQNELGPLMEPEPIQFSFNTPGWHTVGILLILASIFVSYRTIKLYKKNTYRREAIKKIKKMKSSGSPFELAEQLSSLLIILKLVALKSYGRQKVANLYGRTWLDFLESKSKNTSFKKFENLISRTVYQNIAPDANELMELKQLSKKWIQHHA